MYGFRKYRAKTVGTGILVGSGNVWNWRFVLTVSGAVDSYMSVQQSNSAAAQLC